MADIFNKRAEEQIIGRIGRLDNKGTWQYVLFEKGSKDKVDQLIKLKQDQWNNEEHIKISKLYAYLT